MWEKWRKLHTFFTSVYDVYIPAFSFKTQVCWFLHAFICKCHNACVVKKCFFRSAYSRQEMIMRWNNNENKYYDVVDITKPPLQVLFVLCIIIRWFGWLKLIINWNLDRYGETLACIGKYHTNVKEFISFHTWEFSYK